MPLASDESMETIRISGGDTATPLNLEKRFRLIQSHMHLKGKKVLDLGCGAGEYVAFFRTQLEAEAWGIEFQKDKVLAAKAKKEVGPFVSEGNIEKIEVTDDSFDFVLLNEVLEHVPDEVAALGEAFRVLKPGGTLCVFSPNRLFPFETHGCDLWGGIKVPPYIPLIPYFPRWLASKLFRFWARNYWPWELSRIIRSVGFRIKHQTFVWQTFENISTSQPFLIKKFRRGFRTIAIWCESLPLIRRFGVSQVYFAIKPIA